MCKSLEFLIENVLSLLQKKGWTQKELAKMSGLPASHLSVYLTGKRTPGLEKIENIAEALGVTSSELIKDPRILEIERKAFKKAAIDWVEKSLASLEPDAQFLKLYEVLKNKK